MNFRLTPDQIELRDAVRDYLAVEHGPEVLRRLDSGDARDAAIWNGLVAMGLAGILVPVDRGGLGLGLVEATLVAIELGRANVSEPIADTALVAAALVDSQRQEAIAAGALRVALAHPVNPWVADLDKADLVIGAEQPAAAVALDSVDPLRRLFAAEDKREIDGMLERAALIAAAQLIGGAERMLALAIDYAGQRLQFGQPIGKFQAIKHHLATVATKIEFARPVVLRAADALQHDDSRAPLHVSHVKIAATDAAIIAAEVAIQVHGAMGYTYEVDLHFWMKRAWALAGAWGDRAFHARRIEQAVLDGGVEIGPSYTFAKE